MTKAEKQALVKRHTLLPAVLWNVPLGDKGNALDARPRVYGYPHKKRKPKKDSRPRVEARARARALAKIERDFKPRGPR